MLSTIGKDDPLIAVRQVEKTYQSGIERVTAAADVDLVGYAGEFICVYGASGSGKSTLLNLIAGLDEVNAGEIRVEDFDVVGGSEADRTAMRLRRVGVVFQAHNLIEEFTALENVALPLEAAGQPWPVAAVSAQAQLARVGLAGLEARLPSQLSGGQRQRVGIARALVGDKTVLLADEPTGALDSVATRGMFELIRDLCRKGLLAVVCSHDVRCREYADSVYEMVDGRLTPQNIDVAG